MAWLVALVPPRVWAYVVAAGLLTGGGFVAGLRTASAWHQAAGLRAQVRTLQASLEVQRRAAIEARKTAAEMAAAEAWNEDVAEAADAAELARPVVDGVVLSAEWLRDVGRLR